MDFFVLSCFCPPSEAGPGDLPDSLGHRTAPPEAVLCIEDQPMFADALKNLGMRIPALELQVHADLAGRRGPLRTMNRYHLEVESDGNLGFTSRAMVPSRTFGSGTSWNRNPSIPRLPWERRWASLGSNKSSLSSRSGRPPSIPRAGSGNPRLSRRKFVRALENGGTRIAPESEFSPSVGAGERVQPQTAYLRSHWNFDLLGHRLHEPLPPIVRIMADFIHKTAGHIRWRINPALPGLNSVNRDTEELGKDALADAQDCSRFLDLRWRVGFRN